MKFHILFIFKIIRKYFKINVLLWKNLKEKWISCISN